MKTLSKLFEAPKATEVPHSGFCIFILMPIIIGFAHAFYYLFPNHTSWYSFINLIVTFFFVQFVRKWVIGFVEKRHNEQNSNKWLVANVVFGIATIYMVLIGIVFFN